MSVTNLTILLANPAFPNLRVFTITLVLSRSWYNRRQPEYLSALKKNRLLFHYLTLLLCIVFTQGSKLLDTITLPAKGKREHGNYTRVSIASSEK